VPGQDDILRASRLGAPHLNLDFFNAVALGSILKAPARIAADLYPHVRCFGLASIRGDAQRHASHAAVLGLIVMAITIVVCPDGSALNPARWFGRRSRKRRYVLARPGV